jgi:CRISPR-associated protein Csm5
MEGEFSMKTIKIKAKAISPIHIGSGEIYEPTNFVIDDNKLYSFRNEDFFKNLNDINRKRFLNIVENPKYDSFVQIHKLVKENIKIVKNIANQKIPTSKGIQKKYNQVVGKISTIEAKNRKVFNKFEIQKIQRKQFLLKSGNYLKIGYIPGSSFKGSITTAFGEYLYHNDKNEFNRFFDNPREIKNHLFKDFKVADSRVTKISTKIGFALNKERFEDDTSGLSTLIEVINKDSAFMIDIAYDEKRIDIDKIINSANKHYKPIFDSIFDEENEYICRYIEDEFYEKYKDLSKNLKQNQFLLRVGKHSGARAVTIDKLRDISVKESKYKTLKHQQEETTTWLFGEEENDIENLLPFGWLLCEVMEVIE